MINREELLRTKSLGEAINRIFDRIVRGREQILTEEAMTGHVAKEYDHLGNNGRQETYKKLAEDFKKRTGCEGANHPATDRESCSILEVGCGSGLLTLELAEQTNSDKIMGLDLSEDMIKLAQRNLARKSLDLERIRFTPGSAYELDSIGVQEIDYVVCRNALHRFHNPKKALEQMYAALSPGGKLYLRDLRRDADWQIVLKRIGEERWQTQTLVEDYIGAMAAMFTIPELEEVLPAVGITNFQITDGRYVTGEIKNHRNIKEYETETEYVCIINKK